MNRLTGRLLIALAMCCAWPSGAAAKELDSQLGNLQELQRALLYGPLPANQATKVLEVASQGDVHANELLFKHYTRGKEWALRDELVQRAMTEYQDATEWYLVPGWIRRLWQEELNNRVDPFSEGPTTALFSYSKLKEINRCLEGYRRTSSDLVRKVEGPAGITTVEFTNPQARRKMKLNVECTNEA